jgi:hypothetical protein
MRTLRTCLFVALTALLVSAEEAEPAKFYRLQFVVKEVDGYCQELCVNAFPGC